MGFKKLAEKVADYNERLELGKAEKIRPGHVEQVIEKLRKKTRELEAEIEKEKRPEKKSRLEGKLKIAREHVERAEYLLQQVS